MTNYCAYVYNVNNVTNKFTILFHCRSVYYWNSLKIILWWWELDFFFYYRYRLKIKKEGRVDKKLNRSKRQNKDINPIFLCLRLSDRQKWLPDFYYKKLNELLYQPVEIPGIMCHKLSENVRFVGVLSVNIESLLKKKKKMAEFVLHVF